MGLILSTTKERDRDRKEGRKEEMDPILIVCSIAILENHSLPGNHFQELDTGSTMTAFFPGLA